MPEIEPSHSLSNSTVVRHFQPNRHRFSAAQSNAEEAPEWLQINEDESRTHDRLRLSPATSFRDAALSWLESISTPATAARLTRFVYIRKNTENQYGQYVKTLELFFGDLPLSEIRLTHLERYQSARLAGEKPFLRKRRPNDKEAQPCPTQPQHVNQELRTLIRILKCANLWKGEIADHYRPLRRQLFKIVRALTPAEEKLWLDTCLSKPEWEDIYHYSVLCLDTCMGTNEIRSLRLMDINLHAPTLTVPPEGAKNKYRHRTLPIKTDRACEAVLYLLKRASKIGSTLPEHYLFPFRKGQVWDVTRSMTVAGFKKEWDEVRAASGLMHFRKYDLRHTAITRYAENGTPVPVIMEMAGHVLPHMTQHYTQISQQAMEKAMKNAEKSREAANAPIDQLLRTMQVQYNITPEQMLMALQAQTEATMQR